MKTRRQHILDAVTDMVAVFFDSLRDSDELSQESFDEAIAAGEITMDEIVAAVAKAFK